MPININGTTGISGADGSAATPAIQGADTNTGFFFPAADTVAVATGGTERVRVDSSGNVGIGTSSPSGKLNVQDAVAAGRANITLLNNAAGNTSNRMRIRMAASNGFSGTDLYPYIEAYEENAANAAEGLAFGTYNGSSLSERMRIDSSGNVGIGTSSPATQMHLYKASGYVGFTAQSGANYGYFGNDGTYAMLGSSVGATGNKFRVALSAPDNAATIDSSGRLLLGTTTLASGMLNIRGYTNGGVYGVAMQPTADSATPFIFFNAAGTGVGTISTTASATSYVTTSDYRLKDNVQPMTGALAKVAALKPCTYTWKSDGSAGEGFIAHELAEVVPQCVTGEKDAVDADGNPVYQGIDTSFLVATLAAAIQELKAIVDAQAVEIAALKGAA